MMENTIKHRKTHRSIVKEVQLTQSIDSACSDNDDHRPQHSVELINKSPISVVAFFERSTSSSYLLETLEKHDSQSNLRSLSCENLHPPVLQKTRTRDSGTGDSVIEISTQTSDYVPVRIYGQPTVAYMNNRFDFDINRVLAYQGHERVQNNVHQLPPLPPPTMTKSTSTIGAFLRLFKSSKHQTPHHVLNVRNHRRNESS